jgi:hypothetical protein
MRVIDDELRRRFGDLREADRESMPSFQGMVETARLPEPRRWRTTWTWAAAAAVLIVGIGAGWRWTTRAASEPALTISTWQSPTAGLMRTSLPGASVQSPTFGSVLDGLAYRGH